MALSAAPAEKASGFVEAAQAHLQKNHPKEAIAPLLKARQLAPKNEKILNLLGIAYFKSERFPEAEEVYRELLAANPQVHTLHLNLGLIYIKLNRLRESEGHLIKASALEPMHNQTLVYLGLVHEKMGNLERALEIYQSAKAVKQAAKIQHLIVSRASAPAPAGGADTIKVRLPITESGRFRVEESAAVSAPAAGPEKTMEIAAGPPHRPSPAAPSPSDSGLAVRAWDDAHLPAGVEFLNSGEAARISAEQPLFVGLAKSLALSGWLKTARSSFSTHMLALQGKGQAFFAAEPGTQFFLMDGDLHGWTLRQEKLLAFAGRLEAEERRISAQTFLSFKGAGFLVLLLPRRPLLEEFPAPPFQAVLENVIGWKCPAMPEIAPHNILFQSEKPILRFVKEGSVLLSA
jgi:tetratricopeptide (TPR) repeat protein